MAIKEIPTNFRVYYKSMKDAIGPKYEKAVDDYEKGLVEEKALYDDIKLKDTYICDINSYMFDSVKDNLKNSTDSDISTESNNSIKNCNIIKDYTIRIRFTNQHLFWRAGWYLDGGRLVRSVYKI